jgi:hypothetical protein
VCGPASHCQLLTCELLPFCVLVCAVILQAGIIKEQTMQLGFAVARYPCKSYMDAAAVAAAEDDRQRLSLEAANTRLHAALDKLDKLGTTNLLLHNVGDKVLRLSTLNLETLQPETPPASFWEVRGTACPLKSNVAHSCPAV